MRESEEAQATHSTSSGEVQSLRDEIDLLRAALTSSEQEHQEQRERSEAELKEALSELSVFRAESLRIRNLDNLRQSEREGSVNDLRSALEAPVQLQQQPEKVAEKEEIEEIEEEDNSELEQLRAALAQKEHELSLYRESSERDLEFARSELHPDLAVFHDKQVEELQNQISGIYSISPLHSHLVFK